LRVEDHSRQGTQLRADVARGRRILAAGKSGAELKNKKQY
jgi:hypothetical protein